MHVDNYSTFVPTLHFSHQLGKQPTTICVRYLDFKCLKFNFVLGNDQIQTYYPFYKQIQYWKWKAVLRFKKNEKNKNEQIVIDRLVGSTLDQNCFPFWFSTFFAFCLWFLHRLSEHRTSVRHQVEQFSWEGIFKRRIKKTKKVTQNGDITTKHWSFAIFSLHHLKEFTDIRKSFRNWSCVGIKLLEWII
jgi:hypothetical protein